MPAPTSGLASKVGVGIGKGIKAAAKTGLQEPAKTIAAPTKVTAPVESAKEKLQKKTEEMKEKLAQKSTEMTKTAARPSTIGLRKTESVKESDVSKDVKSAIGSGLTSKLGVGLKKPTIGGGAAAEKTTGVAKPQTARGVKAEEEKKATEASKRTTLAGARPGLKPKVSTKAEDIPAKIVESIKEKDIEDESLLMDEEVSPPRSPIKSPPKTVEQPNQMLQH